MKTRDQIFRVGSVNYLKAQQGGDLLTLDTALISGAAGSHCDSTVTFEQSGSYIKINFGTSTSTAAGGMGRYAKYLLWDTGFTINEFPMICVTMESSGAAETDQTALTASTSLPSVAMGICILSGSTTTPIFYNTSGRWNAAGNAGTTRYTAARFGNAGNRVNWDSNEGDTDNFAFTGGSAGQNGTAAGCRHFRMKAIASTLPRSNGQVLFYRWKSIGYAPATNCDGEGEQQEIVTTGDLPVPDTCKVWVWIGAGNTATGGGPSQIAAIFKARVL